MHVNDKRKHKHVFCSAEGHPSTVEMQGAMAKPKQKQSNKNDHHPGVIVGRWLHPCRLLRYWCPAGDMLQGTRNVMLLMRLTTKRRMKPIQPQTLGQAKCTELQPDSAKGAQPRCESRSLTWGRTPPRTQKDQPRGKDPYQVADAHAKD